MVGRRLGVDAVSLSWASTTGVAKRSTTDGRQPVTRRPWSLNIARISVRLMTPNQMTSATTERCLANTGQEQKRDG